ncbi:intraflagellar transport-associated protein isoform X4 [Erinaceus europaeus]|uniref:Intraflagellar transport-associated protein isoform X4 n=1 Tax=Erinaceus europaeus TaxID=9365 RepID=A0ABM3W7K2_ERIEU|nr:intraflagellar transport-associated protein isoform X4 [Erinaceus europaeus]
MPAYLSGQDIMDEHQLIEEVLDKFVNGHEQTYEEFLSTFTHLSKEDHETKRRVYGNDSSENILTSIKFANGDKPDDHHLENKTISLPTSLQCSEEEQFQIVLDEGQKVGSSLQGDLNRAGKVKVDNFLDLEDLDLDEELKLKMNSEDERQSKTEGQMRETDTCSSCVPLKLLYYRFSAASRRSGAGPKCQHSFLHSFHGPVFSPCSKVEVH